MIVETEVLIIGYGIAGSIAALELAQKGIEVTLISSGKDISFSNSYRAQGGIAFDPYLLKDDILKAGGELCDEKAVDQIVKLGPENIQEILIDFLDVPFEKGQSGKWKFTKEGAHSTSRILFHNDQSGRTIMEAIHKKLTLHPKIALKFQHSAIDLMISSPQTCGGAMVLDHQTQEIKIFMAQETILATGGVGNCFLHTTNGKQACGDGMAMASRVGVELKHMEYIQFHPTTLYKPGESRFLLSEALRGEGGQILSYEHQKPLFDPLAPRDVLARAIHGEMIRTGAPHLWLDISFKTSTYLERRFPTIHRHCLEKGWDFRAAPIPIVPAAHYSCGGIPVDLKGQTSLQGLRAIGETSYTGVHGANRLGSTALLEGLVWAKACADSIQLKKTSFPFHSPPCNGKTPIARSFIKASWSTIKQTLWDDVGLARALPRLKHAHAKLSKLQAEIDTLYKTAHLTPGFLSLRNGAETALLITQGALSNPTYKGRLE